MGTLGVRGWLWSIALALTANGDPKEVNDANLLNLDEVMQSVGFKRGTDPYMYPYSYPSNVIIDYTRNCYRIDIPKSDKYLLKSLTWEEASALSVPARMTHKHPCGVCSTKRDLEVYRLHPNLADPVKRCGMWSVLGFDTKECILRLGFTDACASIWTFNVHNTRRLPQDGGCLNHFMYAMAPPIQPHGTLNPCRPPNRTDNGVKGVCEDRRKFKGCLNTINSQPACYRQAWEDGPYRLNSLLQCDECRSGPIFQKIAGRTRRNSNLKSSIPRPPIA